MKFGNWALHRPLAIPKVQGAARVDATLRERFANGGWLPLKRKEVLTTEGGQPRNAALPIETQAETLIVSKQAVSGSPEKAPCVEATGSKSWLGGCLSLGVSDELALAYSISAEKSDELADLRNRLSQAEFQLAALGPEIALLVH